MQTVADIMTSKVISLKDTDSLYQGRMAMKDYGIRHIPIVTAETGEFCGLLSQRDLLNNAFNVVEKYGLGKLQAKEEGTHIATMMSRSCATVTSQTNLAEAGRFFIEHKSSCLPVIDNGRLVGILTSVDFVKLAMKLL